MLCGFEFVVCFFFFFWKGAVGFRRGPEGDERGYCSNRRGRERTIVRSKGTGEGGV